MALYTLSGRIYIDERDEIYVCQRPLYEDDESLGRRFFEKTTASHTAKLYPHRDKESPRRQAVIISHQMPFKTASKKKVDEISARLSGSNTFAAKMRSSDVPSEPSAEACPRRANEEKARERPSSPKPAKSLLKKPLRTTPRVNYMESPAMRSSQDTKNTNQKVATQNKSQDAKKNVRFKSAGSKTSLNTDTKSKSKADAQKPGGFLRMLLDEG